MDWSLESELWNEVSEWILGVAPWSEMWERKRNIDAGGYICLSVNRRHRDECTTHTNYRK